MKQILFTIFGVLISISIFGQAPQAFNYQGVARDLSGNPISNQNIGLRISILQGSTSGIEVYKELHLTQTNQLGLFNLHIGTGTTVNGIFENLDWGDDKHYLQIEMDENGGSNYQIIGTSELLSVPYALYAEKSGNSIWSQNNNGIDYLNGNVGIGTSNPQAKIDIRTNQPNETFSSLLRFPGEWTLDYAKAVSDTTIYGFNFPPDNTTEVFFLKSEEGAGTQHFTFGEQKTFFGLSRGNTQTPGVYESYFSILSNGNFGIGVFEPKSKLQISNGDVYIEDINSGVIMKSPNGQCWRMTVNNSGQSEFNLITCPN